MESLTTVTIDFQTSHLVFPRLIGAVLALLGLAILATHRRAILSAPGHWAGIWRNMDRPRVLGALILTMVYFSAMVPVGDLWPNRGFGFLFCSIPFLMLNGLLFMHDRSAKSLMILGAVSLIAPGFVWWLFGEIFFLSLP